MMAKICIWAMFVVTYDLKNITFDVYLWKNLQQEVDFIKFSYIVLDLTTKTTAIMCEYSFYPKSHFRFRSFINGMGSIINMHGRDIGKTYHTSPNQADSQAIRKDWELVGNDIRTAINSFSERNNIRI